MAEGRTPARVGAEIVPAGVVSHEHDDVGALLLRLCRAHYSGCSQQQCNGCHSPLCAFETCVFHVCPLQSIFKSARRLCKRKDPIQRSFMLITVQPTDLASSISD